MAKKLKIKPYQVTDADDASTLDAFLDQQPRRHEYYSATQTIANNDRLDLLERLWERLERWPCDMGAAFTFARRVARRV